MKLRLPSWTPETIDGESWLLVFPDGLWLLFEEPWVGRDRHGY